MTSATPPSAFYANMAGGQRVATSKSKKVTDNTWQDLQSESLNARNLASLIVEGFPTSQMTVSQAKSYESIPLKQTFEIWTMLENVSAFSAIMPYEKTNSLHMEGQTVIHQTAMTQQAPERVRAFTLEQKRTRYQTTLQRYQIGIEVTTFSLDTDEGMALYVNDLKAMRMSYLESNACRSIVELQTCLTPWRDPTKRYGRYTALTSDTLRQALQFERELFGLNQREANSLELLDTMIGRAQSKVQGAYGDTYIVDKDVLVYNNQVPAANQTYSIGGPEQVAKFRAGPEKISMDLRGNTIVTFKAFQRDGEDPFKPLVEIVDYMEFYLFRDVKYSGRYEADHEDSHRTVLIWDYDRSQWFGVTTEYVLRNSNRFDPQTGMPYGLNHSAVARHDVEYSASQFNDSYHYTVVEGSKTLRRPCIFLGQISQEHIPLRQIIQKGGEHTVMKMRDLKAANITSGAVRNAVSQARALLVQIENVVSTKEVRDFLAAAAGTAPAVPLAKTSIFSQDGKYLSTTVPTQSYGGVKLPTSPAAVAAAKVIKYPVGYGSYAGFKAIEEAYNDANKNDATFLNNTGFDGAIARTVVSFLNVFEAFVSYAQAFFPSSLGVDATHASPWWQGATAAHAIFDLVVTPQHRLPVLRKLAADGDLVSTPLLYTPRMAVDAANYNGTVQLLNPADLKAALAASPAGLKEAIRQGGQLCRTRPGLCANVAHL